MAMVNRKSRNYVNSIFCQGDKVYFWRNDQSYCLGLAIVIGKDGKQFLLKQGGLYIRVHPCRMQHCNVQEHHNQHEVTSLSTNKNNDPGFCDYPSSSNSKTDESFGRNDDNDENITDQFEQQHRDDHEWVHVRDKRNLPKLNSIIECSFPHYEHTIKCKC